MVLDPLEGKDESLLGFHLHLICDVVLLGEELLEVVHVGAFVLRVVLDHFLKMKMRSI